VFNVCFLIEAYSMNIVFTTGKWYGLLAALFRFYYQFEVVELGECTIIHYTVMVYIHVDAKSKQFVVLW